LTLAVTTRGLTSGPTRSTAAAGVARPTNHDRDNDWRQPEGRVRADDNDRGRDLGRGPGSNNRQDDSGDGRCDGDDARWPERDHGGRDLDPRDVFMRDLDLPRGPEREIVYDARERAYALRGSEIRTLSTVGAFRVVAARDLRDHHGGPTDPRSGDLRHLRDQELVRTERLDGHRDHVVVLTGRGRDLLNVYRVDRHQEHRQEFYAGLVKPREVEHDAQVYQAYLREAEKLEARQARIDRVVLDYELKREYQQWLHERDAGRDDADGRPDREPHEIEEWARQHDLPYFADQVHFPDVRIEYEEIAYGQKVSRFFDRLVERGHATAFDCLHNRAQLYRIQHCALYRAIGQPDSRYRRPVSGRLAIERVMVLDGVLAGPELMWLGTEEEKVAFMTLMAPALPREHLPHVTVGTGTSARVRLFPDQLPIGVETTGRVVFLYLVTSSVVDDLCAFAQRHVELLCALPGWTLRLLFQPHASRFTASAALVARDELTMRLAPATIAELRWYFEQCRDTADPRERARLDERFWLARGAFSTRQCRQLYSRWLTDGDRVFDLLSSTTIADALARGTGRIESQVLPSSYGHLSPLPRRRFPQAEGSGASASASSCP
jgi:hypothetical protein